MTNYTLCEVGFSLVGTRGYITMAEKQQNVQRVTKRRPIRATLRPLNIIQAEARDVLREKAEVIAEIAGVDISTVRRWKRTGKVPPPIGKLLTILIRGDISSLGFYGWRILNGELISPEGWTYGPGEVLALTLLRQRVAFLETERRKFLGLEEQPTTTTEIDLEHLERVSG